MLAEEGLSTAIEALAEAVPLTITALPGERFGASVEAAAYFVVAETVRQNAAGVLRVSAARRDGRLVVEVEGDSAPGSITDLEDRVGALGGSVIDRARTGRADDDPGGDPMRVVIADDEVLLRDGLDRLLTEAGFDVVGKAGTPQELRREVELARPDVAIIDIKMPPTHTDEGLIAAEEIRTSHPDVGCSSCPTTFSPTTRCG